MQNIIDWWFIVFSSTSEAQKGLFHRFLKQVSNLSFYYYKQCIDGVHAPMNRQKMPPKIKINQPMAPQPPPPTTLHSSRTCASILV